MTPSENRVELRDQSRVAVGSSTPPRDQGVAAMVLMRRIHDGEPEALRELMAMFWSGLVRYAAVMTGSPDDGEDVAQSVFVQVWETRLHWTESGPVAGYLFRIARNLSIARIRHAGVRARWGLEIATSHARPKTPIDNAELSEFGTALESALRFLPARRREAFELVRFQGLSLKDAAGVMGVTRRTVANHLYLASVELATELERFRD
jgi:RNA polymerase sigma-70 factor (ECF subfamily)